MVVFFFSERHFWCYLKQHLNVFFLFCSLDTFPYAGTTTTCESLYMGVPCVTMAGAVHAHNVGVSLLSKVGKLLHFHLCVEVVSKVHFSVACFHFCYT